MDQIRDLISRIMARIGRICKCSGDKKTLDINDETTSAEKVAQVQQAILNGEEVQKVSELPVVKPTLRKTLHEMPAATQHTTFQKERQWFDKTHDTRGGGTPSNTFNRLEAFLSTTDPKQLLRLDPTWQQGLPEAPDDRPQPKRSTSDYLNVPKQQGPAEQSIDGLFDEGAFSNSVSISGVF